MTRTSLLPRSSESSLTSLIFFLLLTTFTFIQPISAQQDNRSWKDSKRFRQAILKVHNEARKRHHVEPLRWNNTLAEKSKSWADKCRWEHSGVNNGENLATNYDTPTHAVEAWVDESTLYNFNKPSFSKATGHFTQVVWKNTTSVGCSFKDCKDRLGKIKEGERARGMFLVCWYDPGGNVLGKFGDMVLPVTGGAGGRRVGLEGKAGWALVGFLVVAVWGL